MRWLTAVEGGDTCVVDASLDAGSALTGTPDSTLLSFCGSADGGVSACFAGQGARALTLDGGSFVIADSASDVTGSLCTCALDIAETFSGCTCNVPCGEHYSISAAQ
jgi:hypothetical protein